MPGVHGFTNLLHSFRGGWHLPIKKPTTKQSTLDCKGGNSRFTFECSRYTGNGRQMLSSLRNASGSLLVEAAARPARL